jgi:nitronate monooxygenase
LVHSFEGFRVPADVDVEPGRRRWGEDGVVILDAASVPLVLAPLAGGPSTPELTAAVTEAGGLGTLAFGYLSRDHAAERLAATRGLTDGPFGVNVFVPGTPYADRAALDRFRSALHADQMVPTEPGEARYDDDSFAAKLGLLVAEPVAVVSFTFGLPPAAAVRDLHEVGSEVWVTVTSATDAVAATALGADVLVAQGLEAGGHRGGLVDDLTGQLPLLDLVPAVRAASSLPVVATGAIMSAPDAATALAAGAAGVALGTAFLDCPEAGTTPVHREALRSGRPTSLTGAFTGRTARGIDNWFLHAYADAPPAYPEVHFAPAPTRAAARNAGDGELVNLWAGTAYGLARREAAADVVRRIAPGLRT